MRFPCSCNGMLAVSYRHVADHACTVRMCGRTPSPSGDCGAELRVTTYVQALHAPLPHACPPSTDAACAATAHAHAGPGVLLTANKPLPCNVLADAGVFLKHAPACLCMRRSSVCATPLTNWATNTPCTSTSTPSHHHTQHHPSSCSMTRHLAQAF
jgi:hypothetical protein